MADRKISLKRLEKKIQQLTGNDKLRIYGKDNLFTTCYSIGNGNFSIGGRFERFTDTEENELGFETLSELQNWFVNLSCRDTTFQRLCRLGIEKGITIWSAGRFGNRGGNRGTLIVYPDNVNKGNKFRNIIVKRDTAKPVSKESTVWYYMKQALNSIGFNLIVSTPEKDNQMISDHYYLRDRKWGYFLRDATFPLFPTILERWNKGEEIQLCIEEEDSQEVLDKIEQLLLKGR